MRRVAVSAVVSFVLFGLLGLAGARVNTTASFPVGLYWQVARPATKGDVVWLCPPAESVFLAALARGYLSQIGRASCRERV